MSCDTTQMGADQAVPAHKHACVCASMPLSSLTSIWIRACSSSSRDKQTSLPFRRRHTLNAAPLPLVCGGDPMAHWHASQAPSHEALAPHTLSWTHPFLPSTKCVWRIGCKDPLHTALWSAPLSAALHSRLPWSMCHHHHAQQQQQQMRMSPLLARATALPPVGGDCCCCVVLCCTASLDCSSSSC